MESIFNLAVEGKEDEQSFNKTMNETLRAVEFAGRNPGIPAVGVKITGFARFGLLEDLQKGKGFNKATRAEYKVILKRVDAICHAAAQRNVQIYFVPIFSQNLLLKKKGEGGLILSRYFNIRKQNENLNKT